MATRIKEKYLAEAIPALEEKFGYKNAMQVPKLGRVTVEGVNVVTKHQKARNAMTPGGIIHKEMPIDASNVMLVCPKCGKATRVSHKVERVTDDNGKTNRSMVRICKKCGAEID